jgi:guanosine-3',5'-bis(diphosphate) 3'-pyrophosphohydrolase
VDQVYDLLAVRVICQTESGLLRVLGLLHSMWRPVPGRIKDFIAMPRPNLYQSLHTTLIAPGGHQFEVQIRTEEMHRVAEEGIAAHWKYKAGDNVSAKDEQRLAWVRQLMEWQREMTDPNEFMSTLKIDLYPEEVYTFTPKGKVIVLPKDASPIDFAYAIHTEVGHDDWREGERAHRSAAHEAAQRRHRRDHHAGRPCAFARLAELYQELARTQQDQALAE